MPEAARKAAADAEAKTAADAQAEARKAFCSSSRCTFVKMGFMDFNMVQEHFCRHLFEILGRFAIESFLEMTATLRFLFS